MKKQIAELQNYLINRITNCDFDKSYVRPGIDGWFYFKTEIDGLMINFSVITEYNEYAGKPLYCAQSGDIKVVVPDNRLQNLLAFIEAEQSRINAEKVADLKKQIAEIENNYEV